MRQVNHLRRIRIWLAIFTTGLILSGLTAFPLTTELRWVISVFDRDSMRTMAESTRILPWMRHVDEALSTTNANYPFLAYGTDWLAFAHIVIANCLYRPLRRSGPQQMGCRLWPHCLRGYPSARTYRRGYPRNSVFMASC